MFKSFPLFLSSFLQKGCVLVSRYTPTFSILLLMAFAVASVSGLQGFMWSHAGTAGGHLLSVAMNSWGAPLYMHATMLYSDGTLLAYNHPAPLFIWVQMLVVGFADTFLSRLQTAYYLSACISAFTLGLLYITLQKFGIRRGVAAATVLAICGTDLYATFRGFITYDILNPLLSILFLITIARIELAPTRRNIHLFIATGIFALMSSYYAVTIIAVYLGTQIIRNWHRHGFTQTLRTWQVAAAGILAGFTVLQFGLLSLQEYLATGTLTSWSDAMGRQSDLDGVSTLNTFPGLMNDVYLIMNHFLVPLVIAGVLLLPKHIRGLMRAKADTSSDLTQWKPLCTAALYITAGNALFITLTFGWSSHHPFAYFWYAAPLAVAIAFVLNTLPKGPVFVVFAIAIFINTSSQLFNAYLRDYVYSMNTHYLFEVIDRVYPPGTTYQYVSPNECGVFTGGHLYYIGSYPNHWLQKFGNTPTGLQPPHVDVSCGADNHSLNFDPSPGQPGEAATIKF